MMGTHEAQRELFSYGVDLDRRVRKDHPLRAVAAKVDFSFIREEVRGKYGRNGNVGLDPEIVLKLMFLLFWDNVRSESELMRVLPERLDYLWFLGYGLDDEVPNHSVLSKARTRWGGEIFEAMFVRSVSQCVEAGLVGGDLLHMDGSLIDANASKDTVLKSDPEMIARLREAYASVGSRLDEPAATPIREEVAEAAPAAEPAEEKPKKAKPAKPAANDLLISMTDPDTACVRKKTGGESRPRYKAHRAVDDENGVIVATETTPGDVAENAMMKPLIEQSERNVGKRTATAAATTQLNALIVIEMKKFKFIMIVIAALIVGYLGITCFIAQNREGKILKVTAGMTIEEVESLLGEGRYYSSRSPDICGECNSVDMQQVYRGNPSLWVGRFEDSIVVCYQNGVSCSVTRISL